MLIKNILTQLKVYLKSHFFLSRLQEKFPSCHFYHGACIDFESIFGRYNVVFRNARVVNSTFGDHTFIQQNSVVNYADLGKFCSIAQGVSLGLGQHPANYVSSHPAFYSATQPLAKTFSQKESFIPFRRTSVGNDVWIGQNAMVMDGVTIGTGAIVAAGAVVTKDVPEYAIVAGVPARVVKYRFNENVRKQLVATEWWNKDENWLKAHCDLFMFPERFLSLFEKSEGTSR